MKKTFFAIMVMSLLSGCSSNDDPFKSAHQPISLQDCAYLSWNIDALENARPDMYYGDVFKFLDGHCYQYGNSIANTEEVNMRAFGFAKSVIESRRAIELLRTRLEEAPNARDLLTATGSTK